MKKDLSNEQIAESLRATLKENVRQGSAEGEKVTFTLLEDNAVQMGVMINQQTNAPAGVVMADPSNDKVAILEIQSVLEVIKFATPVLAASEMLLESNTSSFNESEKVVLDAAQGLSNRLEELGVYRSLKTQRKEASTHANTQQ